MELLEDNVADFYELFLDKRTQPIERLELLRIPSHGNIQASLCATEPTLSEMALVLAYAYETAIDLFLKNTPTGMQCVPAYQLISRAVHFYWLMFSLLFTEDLYTAVDSNADTATERDRESERDEHRGGTGTEGEREKELRRHLKMICMLLRKKYAVVLVKLAHMVQNNTVPIGVDTVPVVREGESEREGEREGLAMPSLSLDDLNDFPLLSEVRVPDELAVCFTQPNRSTNTTDKVRVVYVYI